MVNSLLYQKNAENVTELRLRVAAAMMRHAVFLVTKASPSANETAWWKYVLGAGYSSMLDRALRYVCAKPTVYGATAYDEVQITDAILMAIVPEFPDALLTTS